MIKESTEKLYEISLTDIYIDNAFNCRGAIAPIDVVDLAKSIKVDGLQQPIIVEPFEHPKYKYRIISGHRRYVAHRVNEAKTIQCKVVAGLDEFAARRLNLIENLKRKDLNILQEANSIIHFKRAGWTLQRVADELGMSIGWVQVRFCLLELPEEIQLEAAAGVLNQEQIKQIHRIPQKEKQYEAVKKVKEKRAAGEKRIQVDEPKLSPMAKKHRLRGEIFDMIGDIARVIDYGFYTRCMSWCAGEISTYDLLRDLKEEADKKGVPWSIPQEVLRKVI